MNNGDKPASPLDSIAESDMCGGYNYEHSGLTKREAFAMAAMQGIMVNSNPQVSDDSSIYLVAAIAVDQADALLAALENNDA